jgi:hypothetical protein
MDHQIMEFSVLLTVCIIGFFVVMTPGPNYGQFHARSRCSLKPQRRKENLKLWG